MYESPSHKTSNDWLAEVAAIFKNLDESDFKAFLNLRQHLYPSIPLGTRKHAAEQIDGLVRQKVAEYKRYDFETKEESTVYINQEIIENFIKKKDGFDYKKLIRLLGELNSNFAAKYPYSSSMLVRAILDHIPPLLSCSSFEEVVNNYSWSKTDKEYMKRLLDFKNEADDALHRQISKDQDLLEMDNLPNRNRVNRLLQECLKDKSTLKTNARLVSSAIKLKSSNITIKLVDKNISWANYSIAHTVWPSFRIRIEIDNYRSNKPDYISAKINAVLNNGNNWSGNHFIFQGIDKLDEEFRIETNEIKKVYLFISDELANHHQRQIPELIRNTLIIELNTRSGEKFSIPISGDQIIRG